MKMLKNQKGFTGFEVVLLVLVMVALGAAGYFAYQARQENAVIAETTPKSKPKVAIKDTASEGLAQYNNTELGFSFDYPKEWGSLQKTEYSNTTVYGAGFSATKVGSESEAISGIGGYNITLYGNSGKQDISLGRGGALWDSVGFSFISGKYYSKAIYFVNGERKEQTAEIENPKVVKAKNTDVILYQYAFFDKNLYTATFNLKGVHYGASFIVDGNNAQHRAQLEKLAESIQVH